MNGSQPHIQFQMPTPSESGKGETRPSLTAQRMRLGPKDKSGRQGLIRECFAVRNSGATAIIEGAGTNGCEYMTGGTVVSLGSVGDNFGAGMAGGMTYIYDPKDKFKKAVNPETGVWQRRESEHYEAELLALIKRHAQNTDSEFSAKLLKDWAHEREHFWQIIPKEMLERLSVPLAQAAE